MKMVDQEKAPKWERIIVMVEDEKKEAIDYFDKKHPDLKHLLKDVYFDREGSWATELKVTVLPSLILMKDGQAIWRISGHPKTVDMDKLRDLTGSSK